MKILVTGGSGFIGQALVTQLLAAGHRLYVSSRQPDRIRSRWAGKVTVTDHIPSLAEAGIEAVINLAGAGIADQRWTAARKSVLVDSRLDTAAQLVALCAAAAKPPQVIISASAVGYYGSQAKGATAALVHEGTAPVAGFAHDLCRRWEAAVQPAAASGVRVACLRIGIVLALGGGMMGRVLLPFKLGLGGRLGDGEQWMPWVHRDDVLTVIERVLHDDSLSGAFNVSAPNPVTNAVFTRSLGQALRRPTVMATPALALRLAFGEMSELLLEGARMVPTRLQDLGHHFQYPHLDAALRDLLKA